MFSRLLLLFVVVPALELYLLIQIGQRIGALETFALILITGIVGSWMAKKEGIQVWREFNSKMASGKLPGKELADGLIILVSGALLLTPGVITDVVGLLGLLPPTRALIRRRLMRVLASRGSVYVGGAIFPGGAPLDGDTIDSRTRQDEGADEEDPSSWSGAPRSRPGHQQ